MTVEIRDEPLPPEAMEMIADLTAAFNAAIDAAIVKHKKRLQREDLHSAILAALADSTAKASILIGLTEDQIRRLFPDMISDYLEELNELRSYVGPRN